MTEKKKGRWAASVSLAVMLAAMAAVMLWAATRTKPLPIPHEAVGRAIDSLKPLPDPVTLGVLGQGEVDGERFGVSGNLDLQTGEDGLEVSLTDFTLGYEEGSTDLEVYINQETAAVRAPELTGETWYGVDLTRDLKAQATQAAGEEVVNWYFGDGQLSQAQATVDDLRAALSQVETLGLSEGERTALNEFVQAQAAVIGQVNGGYSVTMTVSGEEWNALLEKLGLPQMELSSPVTPLEGPGSVDIKCALDLKQRLTALDVTADNFTLLLDLGDPDEPTPRLEVQWGENKANSLELAFTLSDGAAFTAPRFTNVFDLLNLLALGE